MESDKREKEIVLIVDDNPTNLGVLFNILKESDYKPLMATDGEEGISHARIARPDIILLDIIMPGIDGFETCKRLKELEETKDIPVFFMTALSDLGNKVRGFELGAADYITKPFQHGEVLARIKTHLTIQHQKKELSLLNATKDKFFSIIAHDLKNALSGLIGGTNILMTSFDGLPDQSKKDLIGGMNQVSHQTHGLLNNLLEWAQSQTGRIRPEPRNFDIRKLTDENIQLMRMNALEKGIHLENRVEQNAVVYADFDMVKTVIRNLLVNALKYTEKGGHVEIASKQTDGFLEMSVSDNGVGISNANLEKLFRIDARVKTPGTANEKGSGLGLILCGEFVERNGGDIWAQSRLGEGAVFRFTLPSERLET